MSVQLYDIAQLAKILGRSVSSIHNYLYRKDYEAVPKPIKIGRRLCWVSNEVEEWIMDKVKKATKSNHNGKN